VCSLSRAWSAFAGRQRNRPIGLQSRHRTDKRVLWPDIRNGRAFASPRGEGKLFRGIVRKTRRRDRRRISGPGSTASSAAKHAESGGYCQSRLIKACCRQGIHGVPSVYCRPQRTGFDWCRISAADFGLMVMHPTNPFHRSWGEDCLGRDGRKISGRGSGFHRSPHQTRHWKRLRPAATRGETKDDRVLDDSISTLDLRFRSTGAHSLSGLTIVAELPPTRAAYQVFPAGTSRAPGRGLFAGNITQAVRNH